MTSDRKGRRHVLFAAMACAGACLTPGLGPAARAHGIGIVNPPVGLPLDVQVLRSDGVRLPLRRLLLGRTTALQLMFTGCSETCPLQGALFAGVQEQAARSGSRLQLLSLSIDPMDDARSLSAWLRRFGAGRNWMAAVPTAADIDALRKALQAGAPAVPAHSSQVFFVDTGGRLVWRSEDLPPVELVVHIATRLGKAGA
ncbi:SCO family protein [Massilia sp. TN1-12]|uniref:SCO family protein n=1 Tax=Massilia paldalensis TaxID=3377675 RepID=UPI00384EE45D